MSSINTKRDSLSGYLFQVVRHSYQASFYLSFSCSSEIKSSEAHIILDIPKYRLDIYGPFASVI